MTDRNPCLWSRPFILIIALTFLFFLCLHMMNAAFPVFVTQFSHSPGLGGMMTAAFMMAAIMIRPFVGLFLPQINSQKMIMLSLALIFVCIIVSYGAQQVLCLFALRAVEGIGFGIVSTLLATKATGLIPTARMGEGMGFFGMATSLGASLAAVSALSLLHAYSFHAVILAAALLIIGIFAGSLLLPASSTDPSSLPLREKKVAASYIFDQNAMLPSTLVFLLCVTFGGVFNFINGLGEEVGLASQTPLFFLILMLAMLIVRPVAGRIFDRKGPKIVIYPACLCGMTGLLILSAASSVWYLIAAALLYGTAYGTIHPTMQALADSQVAPDKRGRPTP